MRRILLLSPLLLCALSSCCHLSGTAAESETNPRRLSVYANAILNARAQNAPMPLVSHAYPAITFEEAYHIQDRFVQDLYQGRGIGAFKAAVVSAAGRASMGLDAPLTGVLPRDGVLEAADDVMIDLAEAPPRAVETEIGYVFSDTLRDPVADVESLRTHIAAIAPVIEVPGGAVDDAAPATAADLLAWNINAQVIIVGPRSGVSEVDVDKVAITLRHGGAIVNMAEGGAAAGGQWQTLLETVNVILERGFRITPGQVITNGALGKIIRAEVGEYTADYGPLGTIRFTVTDSRERR